jgi:hypothetical protein
LVRQVFDPEVIQTLGLAVLCFEPVIFYEPCSFRKRESLQLGA